MGRYGTTSVLPRMAALESARDDDYRKPELEPFSVANGGMDPGAGNPMGARALYLFQNGVDTLYRVHGDASPRELGRAVSSGCIRMLNQDVIHLHERAVHGASVIVLPSMKAEGFAELY